MGIECTRALSASQLLPCGNWAPYYRYEFQEKPQNHTLIRYLFMSLQVGNMFLKYKRAAQASGVDGRLAAIGSKERTEP